MLDPSAWPSLHLSCPTPILIAHFPVCHVRPSLSHAQRAPTPMPGMPDRLTSALDAFLPRRPTSPHEVRQLRILVCGTLIGLAVAVASVAVTLALTPALPAVFIVVFGVGCVGLLVATRAGLSLDVLRISGLSLLGAFFTAQSLQTVQLDTGSLKWLTLLPLLARLLAHEEGTPNDSRRSASALWLGTSLAIGLATVIVVANLNGWTFGIEVEPSPDSSATTSALIDFALFVASVAGLLSVHRFAQRRLGEELQLMRAMLAVCAWCRRVRDDHEGWMLPDAYIAKHGDQTLTHGMCPECQRAVHETM